MAYSQAEIDQLVEEVKQKMELEKVDVIVSCKCGRSLGMDRVKRKGD